MNNCSQRHYPRYARTGNSAFDRYRQETLERLEKEKIEFQAFLNRLRAAKDQQNFDDFMKEYRSSSSANGENSKTA